MAYELYLKPGFGRRLRWVSATATLRHIFGNLWTSIAGYGHGGSAVVVQPPVVTQPVVTQPVVTQPVALPTSGPPMAEVTGLGTKSIFVRLGGTWPLDKPYNLSADYSIDGGAVQHWALSTVLPVGTKKGSMSDNITLDFGWPQEITCPDPTVEEFNLEAEDGHVISSLAFSFVEAQP